MTQAPEPSRLDRIESILLELATASVRHDNEFSRLSHSLESLDAKIRDNADHIDRVTSTLDAKISANTEHLDRVNSSLDAKISANAEQIAHLTASIAELRNVVSDYIQGRSSVN